jgi:hypothetical protein
MYTVELLDVGKGWIEKDVEETGRGIILINLPAFAWKFRRNP